MQLLFRPDGRILTVYDEAIDLAALGRLSISRQSRGTGYARRVERRSCACAGTCAWAIRSAQRGACCRTGLAGGSSSAAAGGPNGLRPLKVHLVLGQARRSTPSLT